MTEKLTAFSWPWPIAGAWLSPPGEIAQLKVALRRIAKTTTWSDAVEIADAALEEPAESGATICAQCNQPIADRSTYVPSARGPLHPLCWEKHQFSPDAPREQSVATPSDEEAVQEIARPHEAEARTLADYVVREYFDDSESDREEGWSRIMRALALTRAEGQAQERERCAKIAGDTAKRAERASNTADYVDEMVELGKARAAYQILAAMRGAQR